MSSNNPFQSRATVTRWSYPGQFGVKLLVPPPAPAALFLPTTAGPNAEGSIDGALLTPAVVPDAYDEAVGVRRLSVASVRFTLNASDISSSCAIGILPYRDGA